MRKKGNLDLSTEHVFPADKAWAAGFFDGEGCVFVFDTKSKSSKHGRRYDLACAVSQVAVESLMKLSILYGGSVRVNKQKSGTSSNLASSWRVTGARALAFLKDIYPYSIMKKSQIRIALDFPIPNTKPLPYTVELKRADICKELRDERNFILLNGYARKE